MLPIQKLKFSDRVFSAETTVSNFVFAKCYNQQNSWAELIVDSQKPTLFEKNYLYTFTIC